MEKKIKKYPKNTVDVVKARISCSAYSKPTRDTPFLVKERETKEFMRTISKNNLR